MKANRHIIKKYWLILEIWGLLAFAAVMLSACGDKELPGKIAGQSSIKVRIGHQNSTHYFSAQQNRVAGNDSAFSIFNLVVPAVQAVSLRTAFPNLSVVALQVVGDGINASTVNSEYNNHAFGLTSDGQIILSDSEFSLKVPDSIEQRFIISAYNSNYIRLFRGEGAVTLEQLALPEVPVQIVMQVDVDDTVPRLIQQSGCSGDADNDGICNEYEDVFLNSQGDADIDGDSIINSLDEDSDGDGVLDVNERSADEQNVLGKSDGGFPYFASVNHAPDISGVPVTSVNPGDTYEFTPIAGDVDGDELTFSILNRPGWAVFNNQSGELTGTPGVTDVGVTNNIQISVSDWQVSRALPVFDLTVTNTNGAPVITLLGDNPINLVEGSIYIDSGATATDVEDGDLTQNIVINNPVNTAVRGTYTVTYNVTDNDGNLAAQVTRTVNVVANNPPVITLLGATVIDVVQSQVYVDAGATASDPEDGNLTASIVVGGLPVDTNVLGSYVVTYDVSDNLGLSALQIARTVNVIAATSLDKTWVGGDAAAPVDWSTAANWTPAGVPNASDNITIPASAINQPVLSGDVSLRNLTVENGASLHTAGFVITASGSVDAGNTITGIGTVILTGVDVTLQGNLPNVQVDGSIQLFGASNINGNLLINAQGANLRMNGQTLSVANALMTLDTSGDNDATLTMNTPADHLTVVGDILFAGGNTNGKLTDGVINAQAGFRQEANPAAFSASGSHKVVFSGSSQQQILFTHAGADNNRSHFNNVEIQNPVGLNVSPIFINGRTTVASGVTPVIQGVNNRVWTTAGVDIDGMVIDNALFEIVGNDIVRFDNVVFQNQSSTVNQLLLNFSGITTVFNALTFNSLPNAGFSYVAGDGASTITLTNAWPQYGIPRTSVTNGFVINWGTGTEDTDGDGLTDADEFNIHNTSPVLVDTDGDSIFDGEEIAAGTDPLDPASPDFGTPITIGTFLDLEADDGGMFTLGSLWQYGTPATGFTGPTVAHSGVNVWATNLSGAYTSSTQEALYLPPMDLTSASNPTLSFRMWTETDVNDGLTVEMFDGVEWVVVTPAVPAYDYEFNFDPTLPTWTTHNYFNDYIWAALPLDSMTGQVVKLRLMFRSNSPLNRAGFYIDDLRLGEENSDPDGDGVIGILSEYLNSGTDPYNADTDGDGANDGTDNAPLNPADYPGVTPLTVGTHVEFENNDGGLAGHGEFTGTHIGVNAGPSWSTIDLWQWGQPVNGPAAAHSGVNVWATNLTGSHPGNAREALYLPPVNLSGASNPSLSLRMWSNAESNDGLTVEVFDGTNWTAVSPVTPDYDSMFFNDPALPTWNIHNYRSNFIWTAVSLSAYAGQTVSLRLMFRSNSPNNSLGFYFDDLRIDEEGSDPDGDGVVGIINEFLTKRTDPYNLDTDNDGIDDNTDNAPLNPADFPGVTPLTVGSIVDFESDDGGFVGRGRFINANGDLGAGTSWTLGTLWQWGQPTVGPNGAFSGTNVWATNLNNCYFSSANESLMFRPIDLSGATNPVLTFRLWMQSAALDGANLQIYNTVTQAWEIITPAFPDYEVPNLLYDDALPGWSNQRTADDDYTLVAASLADFIARPQPVSLRLQFVSNGLVCHWGAYIDDLRIDEDGVDMDGDGLPGITEEYLTYGSDPFLADTDSDGLNDNVETNTGVFVDANNTGTDPTKADTDGDGINDSTEIAVNSDPSNMCARQWSVVPTIQYDLGQMALTPDGGKLYLRGRDAENAPNILGALLVINTDTLTVDTTIDLGLGFPYAPVVTPDGSKVFIGLSNTSGAIITGGGNRIAVIDTTLETMIDNIAITGSDTVYGTSSLALTPDGSELFAIHHSDSRIDVFDAATHASKYSITGLGIHPNKVEFHEKSGIGYVINVDSNNLSILEPTGAGAQYQVTNTVSLTSGIGGFGAYIAFSDLSNHAYVSSSSTTDIAVVDVNKDSATYHQQVATINTDAPNSASKIVTTPDGRRALLSDQLNDAVIVIDTDPASGTYHSQIGRVIVTGGSTGLILGDISRAFAYVSHQAASDGVSVIGAVTDYDSDGDLLNDSVESCILGTSPTNAKSDSDYYDDGMEYQLGSDATDNGSTPQLPAAVPLHIGPGLSLDDVDDYVRVPTAVRLQPPLTVEAWVNTNADTRGTVFSSDNASAVGISYIGDKDNFRFAINTSNDGFSSQDVEITAPKGHWYHVAWTYSGTTWRAYVNGQLGFQLNRSGSLSYGAFDDTTIGSYCANTPCGSQRPFGGVLRGLRIFNSTRTQAEILQDLNKTLSGSESALTSLWRMEEGSGVTVVDGTGNGNDAALFNGPTWIASQVPGTVPTTVDTDVTITLAGYSVHSAIEPALVRSLPINGTLYQTTDGATRGSQITLFNTQLIDTQNRVIYAPDTGFTGADSFKYRINDGTLDSADTIVNLQVTN